MSSMGVGQAMQLAWLGEAYLLEGRLDDARERAQQAVSLAQRHQERGHEAWSLRLLGEIVSHRDPPAVETAAGHHREALALAGELGMRPLVAHCHFQLGKVYRKADQQQEQAREHLTTATTMYREMDMRFWLDQAEADMRALA
jgi:tetratricopeptide (TPR) repeat protein